LRKLETPRGPARCRIFASVCSSRVAVTRSMPKAYFEYYFGARAGPRAAPPPRLPRLPPRAPSPATQTERLGEIHAQRRPAATAAAPPRD
jgi:hypothetical protein